MKKDLSGRPAVRGRATAASARIVCKQEAPGIFTTELYQPSQCVSIIRQVSKARAWHDARVSLELGDSDGMVLPSARSALILDADEGRELFYEFEQKVRATIAPLIHQLWDVELRACDGTQLIRYKSGGMYTPHKDSSEEPDELAFASRYFTVLCYLNSDFDGGRTHFPGLDYTATPEPGKALVFPSQYVHSAVPVSGGEKFVLLTWLVGPVPVRWI